MMNIDLDFYKENGYLRIPGFFSEEKIDIIFKEAKSVFLKQFFYKNYTNHEDINLIEETEFNECLYKLFEEDREALINCGKQVQHLISLHKLSLSSKVISLLNAAGLKKPTISTRPVMYFNHPKLAVKKVYHTVEAHQDWRSMQGSLNSLVIWTPLIDIDKSLGALQILPKSHLDGLRTKAVDNGFGMVQLNEDEKNNIKSIEVKKGDILLFSSFLIHQSGKNTTNSPRWSCHFRYNDLDEDTFIKRKFAHPYIYKPNDELITENFPTKENILKTFS